MINNKIRSLFENTKKILKDNNIKLKKKLGQSFIIDPFYIKKQIEYAELNKNDVILEIGTGIGNLTEYIAPFVKKIISIELDGRFLNILKDKLSIYNNIELIFGDALEIEFPKFNKTLSNIPYYLSSALTFKILSYEFELGILMYQLEFAKRLTAKPGDSNYGRLSINSKVRANIDMIQKVPKNSFYPIPDVDSALIRIYPLKKLPIKNNLQNFTRIVNELFIYKNKTVRKATLHFIKNLNINPNLREEILINIPYRDKRVRELGIKMVDDITEYIMQFKVI